MSRMSGLDIRKKPTMAGTLLTNDPFLKTETKSGRR
jgi:hypothetical protein